MLLKRNKFYSHELENSTQDLMIFMTINIFTINAYRNVLVLIICVCPLYPVCEDLFY